MNENNHPQWTTGTTITTVTGKSDVESTKSINALDTNTDTVYALDSANVKGKEVIAEDPCGTNEEYAFNPNLLIRRKIYVYPNGNFTGIVYETEDNKVIMSLVDGMSIVQQKDITDDWHVSKSIKQLDAIIDKAADDYHNGNTPWVVC